MEFGSLDLHEGCYLLRATTLQAHNLTRQRTSSLTVRSSW